MSNTTPLLERNKEFARTGAHAVTDPNETGLVSTVQPDVKDA